MKTSAPLAVFVADCLADASHPNLVGKLAALFEQRKKMEARVGVLESASSGSSPDNGSFSRRPLAIDKCLPADVRFARRGLLAARASVRGLWWWWSEWGWWWWWWW